ncbi:PTS lactose/cellobiose transporter subunit IIA [Lactobacillus sp. YT155]|uniref:PTS lactose/cellobiose transporter subunit IIA n=1 Tax=Lactobacillus sp. YT155 TaxID=3060955 RepID=UPI00265F67DD|nr:PTS lactose/cellobiose transporter subunit IIA [Lactobacillus sp. YT155]MDO1605869.1 PTS lactose/cellobiose transporter subunit IIA [Lactobacillus sp. YT155]
MQENNRDTLNEISMQVILHAGNARDIAMHTLSNLEKKEPDFNEIDLSLKKAHEEITSAHKKQTDMLQKEANGEEIPYSVLFVHAQDTLMTIQSEILLIERLVPIFKSIKEINHDE